MLVLSHPLDTYRLADCTREQRGVLGCVVGTQAAIAAGSLAKEDSDIFLGNAEQFGHSLPCSKRSLCPRPDRDPIFVDIGDGARRSEHSMQLKGPMIGRFVSLGCLRERGVWITFVNGHLLAKALCVFEISINRVGVRGHFSGRL